MFPFRFFLFSILLAVVAPGVYAAANIEGLRLEIAEKNEQIKKLEEEINKFQSDLDKTSAESNTLKNQIRVLSTTISKLSTDIRITKKRIEAAELSLEKLALEIASRGSEISRFSSALAEIIRDIHERDSQSLAEIMLARASLSNFFSDVDYIASLSSEMKVKLQELKEAKLTLEAEKTSQEEIRASLQDLRLELDARRSIEEDARAEKNNLLKITKSKEEEYKELLAERLVKKEALEAEIRTIEEELRISIDPSSLPHPGSGVLIWPVESVLITQYFGNTPFATQNPQIYGGKGHNGLDLRAAIGTPIRAALAGVVEGLGNTNLQSGCYSYGKWILIKHNNGLSTLYAHLSHISVSKGQNVSTGQIIGFSGRTGYSTGPHLHFGVYASQGVRIARLGDIKTLTRCANIEIPIASYNSYLNPLSYL